MLLLLDTITPWLRMWYPPASSYAATPLTECVLVHTASTSCCGTETTTHAALRVCKHGGKQLAPYTHAALCSVPTGLLHYPIKEYMQHVPAILEDAEH